MRYSGGAEFHRSQARSNGPKSLRWAAAAGVVAAWLVLGGLRSAQAAPEFGDLHGVTRSELGAPLPGVKVWMHSLEDNSDRNIVSDAQGTFVMERVKPGRYELRASKEGLASIRATTIDLAPHQDLRVDMTLAPNGPATGTASPKLTADLRTPAPSAAPDEAPPTEREKLLLARLDQLEQRLAALEAQAATAAKPAPTPAPAVPKSQSAPVALQANRGSLPMGTAQPTPIAPAGAGAAANAAAARPVLVASLGSAANTNPPDKLSIRPTQPNTELASASSKPAPAIINTPSASPAATPQGAAPAAKKYIDPFSDADWTWLNGNPRTKDIYWDSKFFTPDIRSDVTATWDNHHPADHSMGGSSELFRSGEFQLEQLGIGGDFHYDNVRARFMTQFGAYSTATIRNDGSYASGEWNLADADRYLSEAYGGYHFNWRNGINVDAGIFMSYIGLFSYYNFDNWAYQPSFVSSNTPWFFQGVRVQIFPTAHLKIEPWYINGWQSYASANNRPGLGGQIKWTPKPWVNIVANQYGLGHDDLYAPGRTRIHTDDSIEIKYYDQPKSPYLSKMAFSFTGDLGCEFGNGVSCTGDHKGGPKQSFVGAMLYNRFWFDRDQFGLTYGVGAINNPGRYLVLLPPINGMTAASAALNTPYFTENPGDQFKAWDSSLTFDWMPKQYITFRLEGDYRHASVPYWSGRGGITPPAALGASVLTPNGYPSQYACLDGTAAGTTLTPGICSNNGGLWQPDLRRNEFLIDFDIMVKF